MSIAFISDLHLSPNDHSKNELFIRFLQFYEHKIQHLYILGDFFEFWTGDDIHLSQYQDIISSLKNFNSRGSKISIMHGNRDFLLGNDFFVRTNCQYIPDPTYIDLYGNKTLLTHGDLYTKQDHFYQIYQKFCRIKFLQKLFFLLPKKVRFNIGLNIRKESKRKNQHKIYKLEHTKLLKFAKKNQANLIVFGHIHQQSIQVQKVDNTYIKMYNLGDWGHKGSCLLITPQEKFSLIEFK